MSSWEYSERSTVLCLLLYVFKIYITVWKQEDTVENSLAVSQIKHRIIIWSNNSIPTYTFKITKTRDLNKYLQIHVHSNMIHNSQKVETTQVSTSR